MPEFCNPFTVVKHERKLTHEELVRAIRFMIAAEYEAIQLYQQTAESTDNALAKEVLIDIANEEKEHAGEHAFPELTESYKKSNKGRTLYAVIGLLD